MCEIVPLEFFKVEVENVCVIKENSCHTSFVKATCVFSDLITNVIRSKGLISYIEDLT